MRGDSSTYKVREAQKFNHKNSLLFGVKDTEEVEKSIIQIIKKFDFVNIVLTKDDDEEEQYLRYEATTEAFKVEFEIFTHEEGCICEF